MGVKLRSARPLALALLAALPAPPGASAADPALQDVVVTATRAPAEALGVPASVSVVAPEELAHRSLVRFGDAIADVPGVYVRGAALDGSFPGSGQAVLSLRGIPRTPRTLVMIDGQPINNALSGGINVAGVNLASVERVEVVRGPYSALYGGNAMGGVINFITAGPDQPAAEVSAGAGNLGQRGASALWRHRFESGLGVTMALGWRDSDGYLDSDYVVKEARAGTGAIAVSGARPTSKPDGTPAWWLGYKGARPWSQSQGEVGLHYDLTPSTRITAGAGWAEYKVGYSPPVSFLANAAGVPVFAGNVGFYDNGPKRIALAESDFLTATPSGERDVRLFARLAHRFDDGTVLTAKLGSLQHQFNFSQPVAGVSTYDAGRGEYVNQPDDRVDFDLTLRRAMSASWSLVGGISANHSTMARQTLALSFWREPATQYAQLNAGRGTSDSAALFLQSEHDLGAGVTAFLGVRYDWFRTHGQVTDHVAPTFDETYPDRRFGQFSPKIALVWEARPGVSLRASFGEGFRPPALLDMYSRTVVPTATAGVNAITLPSPNLQPERVRAVEVGTDLRIGGVLASATLYAQQLFDMIYRSSLSSAQQLYVTQNVGEARINGIEGNVAWPIPGTGLRAFAGGAYQFSYEITENAAVPASVGKVLTDVPRTTWSAGFDLGWGPWSGFLAYRYTSHVYGSGDDLNRNTVRGVYGSYDPYAVVSGKLIYRFNPHVSASLAAENLLGRNYFVFSHAPPRTVFAEVTYRL